ncbi:anthranilate phosphoribosyltransferase [Tilletia horrida]|uniref:Anthranilate phosphoribosyltransferase n=1 Tax=Tilletia horrida TaxID=155126 RepID=A0AAN6K029_9BASI|nr:anthranilate phosphoribosyltransferase [Tilletia horrida]KAK0556321.1 anthranilate phosphoribosyltransferase [Tilletia horrida]KAK0569422.1 anthranilate phosphoribosyltransferase [Tilletia horrida]
MAPVANGTAHQEHTSDSFRPLLKALTLAATIPAPVASLGFPLKAPTPALTPVQLRSLLEHLADAEFTSSHANHAQVSAALTALRLTGTDLLPDTITVASEIFFAKANHVNVPEIMQDHPAAGATPEDSTSVSAYTGMLDLVGTGGDGHDTFNVSTTAAIVVAGVPGMRVCKHGAKAASSTSGSADLMLALGVPLLSLEPPTVSQIIPRSSFNFLLGAMWHSALAPLAPIRRALGFPTLFNILGPLINPARPSRCIIGVHSPGLGPIFAEALKRQGKERAWVVCGFEGLDEISIEGSTNVWELNQGEIRHFVIRPADFGLKAHPLSHVASGSAEENASTALMLLSAAEANFSDAPLAEPLPLSEADANSSPGLERPLPPVPKGTRLRALADYTLLQAAALLYVASAAPTLPLATELARTSMRGGGARAALDRLRTEAAKGLAKQEEQLRREEEAEQQRQRSTKRSSSIASRERSQDARGSEQKKALDEYSYLPEPTRDANVGTD